MHSFCSKVTHDKGKSVARRGAKPTGLRKRWPGCRNTEGTSKRGTGRSGSLVLR
jgi:hypothetical protein